jgi:protein-tyrosine phosphatase
MTRVLLVCAGNICRSPTAEGVVRRLLDAEKLNGRIEVDSAGMQSYHVGEAPDRRAQRAAAQRGYDISGLRARQVGPDDFLRFDLILAMDRSCLAALQRKCPGERTAHLGLFMGYATGLDADEVPDPYYGSGDAFDRVLDMVENAAHGLIAALKQGPAIARGIP